MKKVAEHLLAVIARALGQSNEIVDIDVDVASYRLPCCDGHGRKMLSKAVLAGLIENT